MSKRILIVDDEERVLFIMHGALKTTKNGYQIETARNGHEALEKLQEHSFDLILTDLKMPGMGGIEFTRTVREQGSDVMFIWITAYGCHNVYDESKKLGVHLCADKPLEISEIRRIVREALEAQDRSS